MNRRLTALALAGSLALLGACGDDDKSADPPAGDTGRGDKDSSALDLVLASAGHAVEAKTSRFEFSMLVPGPQGEVNLTATGASDSSVPIMSLDMDMAAIMPGTPAGGATVNTIYDGKAVYMKFPEQLSQGLPAGKEWARMDLAALSGQAGIDLEALTSQFNSSDPLANIALLSGAAGEITELGTEDVRGVSTRHLKMTVDLEKATEQIAADITGPDAERLKAAVNQAIQTVGVTQLPLEAWIDADGFPRRISYESDLAEAKVGAPAGATGTVKVTMEFFDFGQDVNLSVPPVETTFDLSEMLGAR